MADTELVVMMPQFIYEQILKCHVSKKTIAKIFSNSTPQRTGRWIEKDDNLYECSECGQYIYSETEHDLLEFHAFCGRCGAKMESEGK